MVKSLVASLLMFTASAFGLTFAFWWSPAPGESAGLSQSDYLTNITFVLYRSTNVAVSLTNWQAYAVWPGTNFANQGPYGNTWLSPQVTNDGNSAFYTLLVSNVTTGGVSPFSNLAPWFQAPSPGLLKSVK